MSHTNSHQNQQQQHMNADNNLLKSGSVPIINGQSSSVSHNQNGSQHYNSTGTPSSQSSRETSRDPSPTQYLHNQYRLHLPKPPMPPINGQQLLNSNSLTNEPPPPVSSIAAPPLSNIQRPFQPQDVKQSIMNPGSIQQSTGLLNSQRPNSSQDNVNSSLILQQQQIPRPQHQQLHQQQQQTSLASDKSQAGFTRINSMNQSQMSSNMNQSSQSTASEILPSSNISQKIDNIKQNPDVNQQQEHSSGNIKNDNSFMGFSSNSMQNVGNPMQNVGNPMQNVSNPMKNISNPMQNISNPMQNISNPMQNVSNPMQNVSNPMPNVSNSLQNISTSSIQQQPLIPNTTTPTSSNLMLNTSPSINPMLDKTIPMTNNTMSMPNRSSTVINPTNPSSQLLNKSSNQPQLIGTNVKVQNSSIPQINSNANNIFNNNNPSQQQQPQQLRNQFQHQQQNTFNDINIHDNVNTSTNAQALRPPLPQQNLNKFNQSAYANQINQNVGLNTYQSGFPSSPNQMKYHQQSTVTHPAPPHPPQSSLPSHPSPSLPTSSASTNYPPMNNQLPSNLTTSQPFSSPLKDSSGGMMNPRLVPRVSGGAVMQPGPISNPYDNRNASYMNQMSNVPLDNMSRRYPGHYPGDINQLNSQMGNLSVTKAGFNDLWGYQSVDLLQCRNVLPAEKVEPPKIKLHQEFLDAVNCNPDIFRCTLTKVPESNSLLQKSRLPLGILIHPFKDLNHLPLIQCSTIVRCRACRTYINPFVYFVDSKRWKCNLCYRVNELPDEFQFDPVTKSYGDPTRRPEVKTSTIEFIAPSEYMLRPPQPAVYLFVLDVSRLAVESGYLNIVCNTIADELSKLPGDSRTQVGFLAVDSAVHFFSMPDNVSQPHELIMLDVDDVFLPCPDNLIVNLKEREELVRDLLNQLPTKFTATHDTNSALGAGLQAAYKLMSSTGGRITVFQTCLPNIGPGALQPREDPNLRASKDQVPHLNPATDFYKRLALDCSGQQIAVDLFLINSQYCDLATLSGICKFSGGCIHHLPLFRVNKPNHKETLERVLRRYLTRKIGFEAVMRIRCTRGLSIHTFHGNFFVRSTDLLSLPNVNPDAGFGMQVAIEENLSDVQSVCFQAALLYTSSKGERRIRVHTLCLPVSGSLTDILYSADQQAVIGLISKMAVDRSQQSSISDARDALINVAIDVFSAYKLSQTSMSGGLIAPTNLKLLPLYIVALLKNVAFRTGTSTRLDDRLYAMCQMKTLPLSQLILMVYPDLYPIHVLDDQNAKEIEGKLCPQPPRLHLSAEKLDFRGAFLMDAGDKLFIYIGKNVDSTFCTNVLGVPSYSSIPEEMYELPELNTAESERLRMLIFTLQEDKPYYATMQIIRDDSHFKNLFIERLIEDRSDAALSYYEFLQHLKTQIK